MLMENPADDTASPLLQNGKGMVRADSRFRVTVELRE
jgi:hypothetical protein